MAEKEVRKTTAKRAPRRTTTKVAPRKTPVRKTVAAPERKAPSRITGEQRSPARRPRSKSGLIMLALFFVMVGAGVGIGYTDGGTIDVSGIIASRKQNATPEEQTQLQNVPVQQTQATVPNGGLVGAGRPAEVPPPVPETTASTTDETASSTEEGVLENTPEETSAGEAGAESASEEEAPAI